MTISFSNVSFRYPKMPPRAWLLRGADLTLGPGIVAAVGQRGTGKTTLARLAVGAVPPTRGRVRVHGDCSWIVGSFAGFTGPVRPIDQIRFLCRVFDRNLDAAVAVARGQCEDPGILEKPAFATEQINLVYVASALAVHFNFHNYVIDGNFYTREQPIVALVKELAAADSARTILVCTRYRRLAEQLGGQALDVDALTSNASSGEVL